MGPENRTTKADENLRTSSAYARSLIEASLDPLVTISAEGKITDVNEASVQVTGVPREKLIGTDFSDYFTEPEKAREGYRHVFSEGFVRDYPLAMRHVSGRVTDVLYNASVYRDSQGQVLGVFAAARDITERKQAEDALRRSKERFRTLFHRSPVGVLVTDRDSRLLGVNKTLCRMLGYSRDELLHLTMLDITHPDDRAATEVICQATAEGKRTGPSIEKRYLRKDGTALWVGVSLAAVNGADGEFSYGIAVVQDISERKQAEEESVLSAQKLQNMMDGIMKAMTSVLEMRDPYTAGHERRVAQLACAIAAQMGVPSGQIEGIRFTGYMHDLGKIAVPAEILGKPGKITENEFGIIKTHPQTGYDILKVIDFLWPVALATLQHHERMNGTGYPQGLSGENILLEARIIGVADVVEAMSSHRPYRPALGVEVALAEIAKNKGTLYDPQVADSCARLFAEKRFHFE